MWKSILLAIALGAIMGGILYYSFWYVAAEILPVVIK